MELVLLVIARALSACLAAIRLRLRAQREAVRRRELDDLLEIRLKDHTQELRLALRLSEKRVRDLMAARHAEADVWLGLSRELRAPLNTVVGFAEAMRLNADAEPLTRRQAQAVDHILGCGRHGLKLIEDGADRDGSGLRALAIPRLSSRVSAPTEIPYAPTTRLPAATLLYVNDDPIAVALMRQVVTALGPLQLHAAETGHEGLTLARDLRPDVILLDVDLPGLSGFALKAHLDADPLTRGLPVLALSASVLLADIERARPAGFRDFLTKPLNIPALAEALGRALGPDATTAREAA